jgi:hypothetical protein
MLDLTIPPDDIPWEVWLTQLRQLAEQDLPLARRIALLRLIWQEAYHRREGLIIRVEDLLGWGCFGPSPQAAFQRDIAVVRQVLREAGHRLLYSRQPDRPGYYIEGRPVLDEKLRRLIAGAVAEVDREQIAIYKRLKPAQRVQQLAHLSDWLRLANERRLRHRKAA